MASYQSPSQARRCWSSLGVARLGASSSAAAATIRYPTTTSTRATSQGGRAAASSARRADQERSATAGSGGVPGEVGVLEERPRIGLHGRGAPPPGLLQEGLHLAALGLEGDVLG